MRRALFNLISTPGRLLMSTGVAVLVAASAGPLMVSHMLHDGGFARYGWNIDLSTWRDVRASQGVQPLMHTEMIASDAVGRAHHEMWINTGQSITFRHVPAAAEARFAVSARIHPEWNANSAIGDPVTFEVVVTDGKASGKFDVEVQGDRAVSGAWKAISISLAPYAGRMVDIEIRPISARDGVWTLWRDPRVIAKLQELQCASVKTDTSPSADASTSIWDCKDLSL